MSQTSQKSLPGRLSNSWQIDTLQVHKKNLISLGEDWIPLAQDQVPSRYGRADHGAGLVAPAGAVFSVSLVDQLDGAQPVQSCATVLFPRSALCLP